MWEADSAPSPLFDERDDLPVDLSSENHFDDIHRLVVGDAQSSHEAGLDAQAGKRRADLRPTAVNDHWAQADVLEQDHVNGKGGPQFGIGHRAAAVFDHDDSIEEPPHVGQRFDQHFRFVDQRLHGTSAETAV